MSLAGACLLLRLLLLLVVVVLLCLRARDTFPLRATHFLLLLLLLLSPPPLSARSCAAVATGAAVVSRAPPVPDDNNAVKWWGTHFACTTVHVEWVMMASWHVQYHVHLQHVGGDMHMHTTAPLFIRRLFATPALANRPAQLLVRPTRSHKRYEAVKHAVPVTLGVC